MSKDPMLFRCALCGSAEGYEDATYTTEAIDLFVKTFGHPPPPGIAGTCKFHRENHEAAARDAKKLFKRITGGGANA